MIFPNAHFLPFLSPVVGWPMKATPGTWSRCTYAAHRALWSGSTRPEPSSSTCGPTPCRPPPPASPSASNPPRTPQGQTSTWTATASCGCCCANKTRRRARCTASASERGRSSSRPSRIRTSAEGLRPSSTSWSATGWERRHSHLVVRRILMLLPYCSSCGF